MFMKQNRIVDGGNCYESIFPSTFYFENFKIRERLKEYNVHPLPSTEILQLLTFQEFFFFFSLSVSLSLAIKFSAETSESKFQTS